MSLTLLFLPCVEKCLRGTEWEGPQHTLSFPQETTDLLVSQASRQQHGLTQAGWAHPAGSAWPDPLGSRHPHLHRIHVLSTSKTQSMACVTHPLQPGDWGRPHPKLGGQENL